MSNCGCRGLPKKCCTGEKLLKHTQICFSLWLFILYVLNTKIIVPGLAESVKSLKVQLESCLNSLLREGERNAECVNCPSGKKIILKKKISKQQTLHKYSKLE